MVDANPLEGEAAVVTGASSGIGAASARALARDGADVVVAARREERLAELVAEIEEEYGVRAEAVPTDVTDESQVAALVEAAVDAFGGLDIAVANAGVGLGGAVEGLSTDDYRTMMDVNCDGAFFTAREAVPHLKESSGNLVFVASFAGQYPRPGNPIYAATKWWTIGFARSLEASVGDEGVAVTTVNPTEVRTEFGSEEGESFEERFDESEVTAPADVAEAVAFAAKQSPPNTASSVDLYRRDKFSHF